MQIVWLFFQTLTTGFTKDITRLVLVNYIIEDNISVFILKAHTYDFHR